MGKSRTKLKGFEGKGSFRTMEQSRPKPGEVICYAVAISTDEVYSDGISGGLKMKELVEQTNIAGVYQDPRGFEAVMYRTPEERLKGYEVARRLFITAAAMPQVAYVEEKYLKPLKS